MTRYTTTASLLLAVGTLTACGLSQPQQQALITSAVTLGTQAAANNTTAQKIIDSGRLLCKVGPLVVAVAGINVVGSNADDMAAVCNGLGGVGTGALAPGQTAATVPVVSAPAVAIKPKS